MNLKVGIKDLVVGLVIFLLVVAISLFGLYWYLKNKEPGPSLSSEELQTTVIPFAKYSSETGGYNLRFTLEGDIFEEKRTILAKNGTVMATSYLSVYVTMVGDEKKTKFLLPVLLRMPDGIVSLAGPSEAPKLTESETKRSAQENKIDLQENLGWRNGAIVTGTLFLDRELYKGPLLSNSFSNFLFNYYSNYRKEAEDFLRRSTIWQQPLVLGKIDLILQN